MDVADVGVWHGFCPTEGRCVADGMLQVCGTSSQASGMQGEVEV